MGNTGLESYPALGLSEPVSCLSHLLGAAVFASLSYYLIRRARGSRGRVAFLAIFAFSGVFVLVMSGIYHLLTPGGMGRTVLQRLDHAAIFMLIAGTFTAVHGVLFVGPMRWGVLAVVWSVAALGITLKTAFFHDVSEWVGLALYLALGWSGTLSCLVIWRRFGWRSIQPLLGGAFAYTSGAVLDFLRAPVLIPGVLGPHEIFHVAVLAGLGCHWKFVHTLVPSLQRGSRE